MCATSSGGRQHSGRGRRRRWRWQMTMCRRLCRCCRWHETGCLSACPASIPLARFRSSCCFLRNSSNGCLRTCATCCCKSSRWNSRSRCRRRCGSIADWRQLSASFRRRSSGWRPASYGHSVPVGSTSRHSPPCCSGSPSARSASCR